MTWIKFHGEIRRGKHRGIPRALRFVFLELAHEAREKRFERRFIEIAKELLDPEDFADICEAAQDEDEP